MYEIVSGPLVWIAALVFVGGSIYRIWDMIQLAKKERVILPYMGLKFSLRSLAHWMFPFATRNMRLRPFMTVVTFAFHICLLLTPLFLLGHLVVFEQAFGFRWWNFPEGVADFMTVIVLIGALYFLLRRLTAPEVLYVSTIGDWVFLAIVLLTFGTGIVAHYQLFAYETVLICHILAGEAMLVAIPFTRLSHMIFFFFTRAYMGCEFGAVRNSRDW